MTSGPDPRDTALDIAVVGGGAAGLSAAWLLNRRHRVTLYEREARFGGHANTVPVVCGRRLVPVDTGFIVYNEANYPNFSRLLAHLGVGSVASNMSFSVSLDRGRLEYSGGEWTGLFAQPANLFRGEYWRMLGEIVRFFRVAPAVLDGPGPGPTLGDFLTTSGFSRRFLYEHLLPMGAAIWSVPVGVMLRFPARSFVQFFQNHGLLRLTGRPRWRTVAGGSRAYVSRVLASLGPNARRSAGVASVVRTGDGPMVVESSGACRMFDHVVIAAPANEALAMLVQPSPDEARALAAFRYQPNLAVLHRDPRLMPVRRRAWASWNYLGERRPGAAADDIDVSVTYWINRLQSIDAAYPLFVSLNPVRAPREDLTIAAFEYQHPVFDQAAMDAQIRLSLLQGRDRVWFCGSYWGYGFHEDAVTSGFAVAEMLGARRPWSEGRVPVAGETKAPLRHAAAGE